MRVWKQPNRLSTVCTGAAALLLFEVGWTQWGHPVSARPVPDTTLGAESSVVTPVNDIRDLIEGGAIRGSNLFHSFTEFNIDEGREAYFANPVGIENILSRVTGNEVSDIFGTLGVNGAANLFLLNPNGIIFGPNSQLDVGGSFLVTTADSILFDNFGSFSSTNPEIPSQLLTVDPSAFLFNQVPTGDITVRSSTPLNPALGFTGLSVPPGENLTLLGGDVRIEGGGLNSRGGHVDIVSVNDIGVISLEENSNLIFPATINRGNITLTNGGIVNTLTSESGGDISITAATITLRDESILVAGIFPGQGSRLSQSGNISLDATALILLTQASTIQNVVLANALGNAGNIKIMAPILEVMSGSQLLSATLGQGNAGNIVIDASEYVRFQGSSGDGLFLSSALSNILSNGVGAGGNIEILSPILEVLDGAELQTIVEGKGDAGNIIIRASERITFQNDGEAFSTLEEGGIGTAGNIEVTTPILEVLTEAALITSTFGQGDAGNVIINASDHITFSESDAFSRVAETGIGMGGNIIIATPVLEILDGARLFASTFGQGDAGNVIINASERVTFKGTVSPFVSSAFSFVAESGVGSGGNIEIIAPVLELLDGARLISGTFGQGNAGNIVISATEHFILSNRSAALSTVEEGGVGSGGNIEITTPTLELSEAGLNASTSGQGDAGSVIINASEYVIFTLSTASSTIAEGGIGMGGNIEITTPTLEVLDGAQLQSGVLGQGNAGNVIINASERVTFQGTGRDGDRLLSSDARSSVEEGGIGVGGNIEITTPVLEILDGAGLVASTRGQGNAGSVIINASEHVLFQGRSNDGQAGSDAFSSVEENANGNGGNIEITAPVLEVLDGAQLQASTRGRGNAGNIIINVSERVTFQGNGGNGQFVSSAQSRVDANGIGGGGNIEINTSTLEVLNGGQLQTSTFGRGDAGNIIIGASNQIILDGVGEITLPSGLFTNAFSSATGRGNNVAITTPWLQVSDGAVINTRTENDQPGGNVSIEAERFAALRGGQIITTTLDDGTSGNITINANHIRFSGRDLTFAQRINLLNEGNGESGLFVGTRPGSVGNGGIIRLDSSVLSLSDDAQISSLTEGAGKAGNVIVRANHVNAEQGGQIRTSTSGNGNAGSIRLNVSDYLFLSGNGTGLFASTDSDSSGLGGAISLSTDQLRIQDGAEIGVNSQGFRRAGNLEISANDVYLDQGSVTAETLSSRRGSIRLQIYNLLDLDNGSQISASTQDGQGGEITINANSPSINHIFLNGRSRIATEANGNGEAGGIRINAESLSIDDQSEISASSQSSIGGAITINGLTTLELDDQSSISAETQIGRAGSLFIDVSDQVVLNGGSRLSVEAVPIRLPASPQSTLQTANRGQAANIQPIAGNLTLLTDTLQVLDGSSVTVRSPEGQAGNIDIDANQILLSDGEISAETAFTSSDETIRSANVDLGGLDFLFLDNGSVIAAQAIAGANGGNIDIDAEDGFIVATAAENNDIIASAEGVGPGGNINIAAVRIFNLVERQGLFNDLRANNTNDISVTSELGTNGIIAIEDLGVDPVQAAADLPTITDSPPLSQGCQPGIDGSGQFINTEQGGIPPNPSDPLDSGRGWEDVYPVTPEANNHSEESTSPDHIVEAEGWQVNEQGNVILFTSAASHSAVFNCQGY